MFKQYPFIGNESQYAANASLCAAEQGKFWEYVDKLFHSQKGENIGAFSKDNLKKFATDSALGLDTAVFNSCLDGDKYNQRVKDEYTEGVKSNVRSTPTFLLDGQLIEGDLGFAEFQKRIDAALAKKQ